MNELIKSIEAEYARTDDLGAFNVGDTVNVHTRIREGDKERIQLFTGTVIRKKAGHGSMADAFTVRRIADGVGVERTFPSNSPKVEKVEVVRHGKVRRAKLYYLRDRVGKATKVKERLVTKSQIQQKKQQAEA
ncbi:MAG: 50S ribosomal protein L19 [Planctomycetota bacterium]